MALLSSLRVIEGTEALEKRKSDDGFTGDATAHERRRFSATKSQESSTSGPHVQRQQGSRHPSSINDCSFASEAEASEKATSATEEHKLQMY